MLSRFFKQKKELSDIIIDIIKNPEFINGVYGKNMRNMEVPTMTGNIVDDISYMGNAFVRPLVTERKKMVTVDMSRWFLDGGYLIDDKVTTFVKYLTALESMVTRVDAIKKSGGIHNKSRTRYRELFESHIIKVDKFIKELE